MKTRNDFKGDNDVNQETSSKARKALRVLSEGAKYAAGLVASVIMFYMLIVVPVTAASNNAKAERQLEIIELEEDIESSKYDEAESEFFKKYQSSSSTAESKADDNKGKDGDTQVGPGTDYDIKGNITAQGERIYHMPGDEYYDETAIDESRGERWFSSPEEAEAAGWRRAYV